MSFKRNVLANYVGHGWSGLMSLVFIPVYIEYLGMEAYGLIGVFVLLQAWMTLLDMGMKPTLSREMARYVGGKYDKQRICNLLRSIECIAVIIAVVIVLSAWVSAQWLTDNWLRIEALPSTIVMQAFILMSIVIALRFMEGIYASCLVGLQKQVLLNFVLIWSATARGAGAVGVLVWISPTITAFFVWQGIVSLISLLALIYLSYKEMPLPFYVYKYSLVALKDIAHFARGVVAITFGALILTQVDKILLANLLDLSDYGNYALAAVVAGGMYLVVAPIAQAYFPKISELYARNSQHEVINVFHKSAQLVAITVGSSSIVLMMFSDIILNVWTGNPDLATRNALLLSALSLGNLLNCIMFIPYQTQLAYGWTGLTIIANVVAVLILIPLLFVIVPQYGALGAAVIWIVLNVAYVVVCIHFMFRKILIGEKWRWYIRDTLMPLVSAATIVAIGKYISPYSSNTFFQVALIVVTAALALVAACYGASEFRTAIKTRITALFDLRIIKL